MGEPPFSDGPAVSPLWTVSLAPVLHALVVMLRLGEWHLHALAGRDAAHRALLGHRHRC
jgi:hypothetical protein